jgi:dihydrofolate synthase/folylpolyglutamate synthase
VNCEASLAWLYSLQQFGIKLGLQNIRELLSRLDNPQRAFPCLHIAGTNGKGSVSVFLAEICRHAGYRVGLYTSPHLHSFTERIRLDGEPLAADLLPDLVDTVRRAAAGIPVTFFEATTALALLAFRRAGVEVAVIETGMGGRLDATNVIDPMLCCITPVAFDHQEHLGTTLAAIAAEKAGIIKPGVPLITAVQTPEAGAVLLATAAQQGADVWQADRDYRWGGNHRAMWFQAPGVELGDLPCALPGEHQLGNLAQALAGAVRLRGQGLTIPDAALSRAGASARWPGRLEWFGAPPRVLLDGAHNQAGATALAAYLKTEVRRPVRLVAGLSGKRSPDEVLTPLRGEVKALYVTPVPDVPTVATAPLVVWGEANAVPTQVFDAPGAALAAALAERSDDDVVVVAGSLYLVAAVRALLQTDKTLLSGSDDQ